MSAAEVPAAEVAAAEVHTAEMPAAEVHAAEMTASETSETSEMTASEAAEVTASAKVTASAEPTMPKGKGFAHRARHHARRERGFETEPERDRRRENFCRPTSHGARLPPRLRNYDPHSVVRRANA
jgi:hypothetical protein